MHRNPSNVEEASFNVCAALDALRHSHYRVTPRLACDPESILAGDKNVVFGLLWEVGQVYPKTVGFSVPPSLWHKMSVKHGWLQYPPLERRSLKQVRVSWGRMPWRLREASRTLHRFNVTVAFSSSQCLVNWLVDLGVLLDLGLHDRTTDLQHDLAFPNDFTVTRDALTGRVREQHMPELFELGER